MIISLNLSAYRLNDRGCRADAMGISRSRMTNRRKTCRATDFGDCVRRQTTFNLPLDSHPLMFTCLTVKFEIGFSSEHSMILC